MDPAESEFSDYKVRPEDDEFISHRQPHSTTAMYPDSLRHRIIDAVEKRVNLWDIKSREPLSLVQRKESFAEIAKFLSTKEYPLRGSDIEKQWKNLKDTYLKVKKKHDRRGRESPPRWRFYKRLGFIGSDDDSFVYASPSGSDSVRPKRMTKCDSESVAKKIRIQEILEKASAATSSATAPSPRVIPPLPVAAPVNNDEEDDYSYYCQYLGRQLRLINNASKTEFLKVQKRINDVIFEAQIMLSSREST